MSVVLYYLISVVLYPQSDLFEDGYASGYLHLQNANDTLNYLEQKSVVAVFGPHPRLVAALSFQQLIILVDTRNA